MSGVLSVKNLAFSYDGVPLLKRVNLSLMEGNLLMICGLSGQGKTALLRLLIGLEKPLAGEIRIFDRNIHEIGEREFNQIKAKTGFVFQNSALISTKTVEENLKLPLIYHNLTGPEEIEQTVENTLEKLLIKEYRHKFPGELSLGIQKRTAMARAIITDPRIILMDEPTIGLDGISKSVFISLIENIRILHNAAMIMVTNDLTVARDMGGEISILRDGTLMESMPYEVLRNYPDSFVQSLMDEDKQRIG